MISCRVFDILIPSITISNEVDCVEMQFESKEKVEGETRTEAERRSTWPEEFR